MWAEFENNNLKNSRVYYFYSLLSSIAQKSPQESEDMFFVEARLGIKKGGNRESDSCLYIRPLNIPITLARTPSDIQPDFQKSYHQSWFFLAKSTFQLIKNERVGLEIKAQCSNEHAKVRVVTSKDNFFDLLYRFSRLFFQELTQVCAILKRILDQLADCKSSGHKSLQNIRLFRRYF